MLTLLVVWSLLLLTSYVLGALLLSGMRRFAGKAGNERFLAAVWCGLAVQAVAALWWSLISPVTAWVAGTAWIVILVLGWLNRSVRAGNVSESWETALKRLSGIILLAVIIAFFFSQAPCNYDTLLYHHQATKWFAQYGAVQGVALLHARFGFTSAWFALSAPLEYLLPGRSATGLNGFVLLVAMLQILFDVSRYRSGAKEPSSLFCAVGLASVIGLHLLFLEPVNAGADFPVAVLTIVVTAMLLDRLSQSDNRDLSAPLLLASILPALKFSALPVSVAAAAVYLCRRGSATDFAGRLAMLGGLVAASLLPLILVTWRTSGAVLFPLPALSSDVPWGVGPAVTQATALEIKNWARWGGPVPEGADPSAWLYPWLSSPKGKMFCFFALGNLVALGWSVLSTLRARAIAATWIVPFIGCLGTLYLFITAPNPRFGFGVLLLGWCWLAASGLESWMTRRRLIGHPIIRVGFSSWSLIAVSTAVFLGLMWRPVDPWRRALNDLLHRPMLSASEGRVNWLWPASVPSIGYTRQPGGGMSAFPAEHGTAAVNDVVYRYCMNTDICGPASLPAAPTRLSGIRLADPDRGLAGGFVKTIPLSQP